MAFDGQLGGADGGEGVDHTESVPATGCDSEDLEGSVGHETGVGIAELSLSVDQQRFGILASVDGQTAGISLSGVLVEPITDQHDVRGQVKVVQVTVGISGRRLADDNTAVEAVHLL